MDRRKFNKGTKGNKGGRKPKSEEVKAAEQLRAVLDDKSVVERLASKVNEGDMKAIELWMAYIFGKPQQHMDLTSEGKQLFMQFVKNGNSQS